MNVAFFDIEEATLEYDKWVLPEDPDALREMFSSWCASSRALVEVSHFPATPCALSAAYYWTTLTYMQLLLDTQEPSMWAMWDHPLASTYTKGWIAMMGDAAHATTPYQGQGAAQAIEDALVLEILLAELSGPKLIQNAFLAFDQARRSRTQRVVLTSRDAGQLVGMRAEGVGSDIEKMRELLSFRVHWIWNRDMVEQNRQGI